MEETEGVDAQSIEDVTRETFTELSGDPPAPPIAETTTQPSPEAAPSAPQAVPVVPAVTRDPAAPDEPEIVSPRANERIRTAVERAKQAEARFESIAPTVTQLADDPIGFYLRLGAELHAHPTHQADPRLRTGRATGNGHQPQAEPSGEMPEITPLVDSNGNRVFSEADTIALIDFKVNQALGKMQESIAPMQQERAHARQRAEAAQVVDRVQGDATRLLTEYRQAPGWTTATEPAIKTRFAALCQQGLSPEAALGVAYAQVVAPTLGQSRVQQVVSALQTKPQTTTLATRAITAPGKGGAQSISDITREVYAEMAGRS